MCLCASQSAVSYQTYRQTDRQNTTSTCNVFSVSGIIIILHTSHHKSASVPQQHMPAFPNLLYSNATRNCSELLTAPKSNTHAAVSVAEKCNIQVNMCLWVSLLVHCSTFSWPTHQTALHKQRCSRFAFCCYYVLLWATEVSVQAVSFWTAAVELTVENTTNFDKKRSHFYV
jgi:hypothetical protein